MVRRPWLWIPAMTLLAIMVAILTTGPRVGAQAGRDVHADFDAGERRRLRAGELVHRPVARRAGGHHRIGGTSFQRVRAPQARVFREALDVRNYPRLIPAVDRARVVAGRGDDRVVLLRHRYSFATVSYHARVRVDRSAHTIRFELDPSRPHDVRAGHGHLSVEAYRGRESIVTWAVMADAGSGIVSGLFGSMLQDWILRVPFCVRGHIEPGRPGC